MGSPAAAAVSLSVTRFCPNAAPTLLSVLKTSMLACSAEPTDTTASPRPPNLPLNAAVRSSILPEPLTAAAPNCLTNSVALRCCSAALVAAAELIPDALYDW